MPEKRQDRPEDLKQRDIWLNEVIAQLQLDVDELPPTWDNMLELIAQVAHGPSRPGAPLTAMLVGYAVGKNGADWDQTVNQIKDLL